ncbi:hypothetical protein N7468_001636 [Penicillium chermesinum]|uniref:Uncharacterized protein n=1 Tax=Penicillium chermesinum TaxID=63820 RepID=A0A9W9TXJ4_9EURO|nr:uncharacterized protein N7468_001636 [Penicillium chermesinum]KAJ5246653.1 hypothetical protein N7468_001636 [Penicillium chermesinum]
MGLACRVWSPAGGGKICPRFGGVLVTIVAPKDQWSPETSGAHTIRMRFAGEQAVKGHIASEMITDEQGNRQAFV